MNKDKCQRYDDVPARLNLLAEEFHFKVLYDFGSMLFLGLKENQTMKLKKVEDEIAKLSGYARHRTISYYENVSHLYVEFDSPAHAIVAREHFMTKNEYHAEIVDQILKNWYAFEMATRCKLSYDIHAKLLIDGRIGVDDLLSEDSVTSALRIFGNPTILEYRKRSVAIAFSSMTEGIAACIVHGQWKSLCREEPHQFYRIRLERSPYFARLLRPYNSLPTLDDTYHLEYFMPDKETQKRLHYVYDCDEINSQNVTQRPTREFFRSRGSHRHQWGGGRNERFNGSSNFNLKYRRNPGLDRQVFQNANPY